MLGALAETFPDEQWRERALESARLYPAWVNALDPTGEVDFIPGGEAYDGSVDPRDLLRVLSRQVRIVRRDVANLDSLDGEQIVVCAGAWASSLGPIPAVVPVKGYLIAWDGIAPGQLGGILREGHTYILQRRGGRVIAGSTEQRIGFDASLEEAQVSELRSRAEALLPTLKDLPVADVWFGFRPAAEGNLPVLRRHSSRVVLAYGHYRNGILLAPWTARWVADEIQRQLGK